MHNLMFRAAAATALLFAVCLSTFAQSSGFNVGNMDKSTDACQDFFQYANGNWLKTTEIPASESRWGTFNVLADNNNSILRRILENAQKERAAKGSDTQLIGDFYDSCMNMAAINSAGIKPLEPMLRSIRGVKSVEGLEKQIALMHNEGLPAVFGFGATADMKDSNSVIASAGQGGISLPNRDYYTKTDPKSIETREKFVEYAAKLFILMGDKPDIALAEAKTVLAMQTRLAEASLTPVERRNPDNVYNKISLSAAQKLTPDFLWDRYVAERHSTTVSDINVAPVKFFTEMNAMLRDVPIGDWQSYLRFMAVNSSANSLSQPFIDARFDFYSRYLSGQKEQQPRWKTCVEATDGNLGEALGMQYAQQVFKPESKARMGVLIDNLMYSLRNRIDHLDWMSDATKEQAKLKLSTFKRKIGYPDTLRGYKGLEIKRDSYAGNSLRVDQFQLKRNLEDIGKPRDKSRMGMTPPTVNASYSGSNNDITFPAGILQPPFFNGAADDAINYGAIGGVIGHEITHGFDDQGSRFDSEGNLKMWWTKDDRTNFDERAACVAKQFDSYEVQPGLFINGKLTLGENIGDFAGMTVSYDAFMKSLEGKPRPADIDGFTPEQRFFLGWAQVWAGKYTPEAERTQVSGNPHSLPRWRVNGPMSNMPQFAKAWGCKAGDAMVRKDACIIW